MNSPNLTTVPLPSRQGEKHRQDYASTKLSGHEPPEAGHRAKTGENSRPINGEEFTARLEGASRRKRHRVMPRLWPVPASTRRAEL